MTKCIIILYIYIQKRNKKTVIKLMIINNNYCMTIDELMMIMLAVRVNNGQSYIVIDHDITI